MPMGQATGLGSGSMGLMDERMIQVMQMLQALRSASGFGGGAVQQGMRPSMAQFQPNVMPMQDPNSVIRQSEMTGMQDPNSAVRQSEMVSMLPMMLMMMKNKGLGQGSYPLPTFPGVPSGFRM